MLKNIYKAIVLLSLISCLVIVSSPSFAEGVVSEENSHIYFEGVGLDIELNDAK